MGCEIMSRGLGFLQW